MLLIYALPFITAIILVMISYLAVNFYRNKATGVQKSGQSKWLYTILTILLIILVTFEVWSIVKLK